MKRSTIEKDIATFKKKIDRYIRRDKVEMALQFIRCAAQILYNSNICYHDEEIENYLLQAGGKIGGHIRKGTNDKRIIFYDGPGYDLRGVSYIYLRALLESGYCVDYVMDESRYKCCPQTMELISKYPESEIICLKEKSEYKRIKELEDVISSSDAKYAILYPFAYDEVGVCVWNQLKGKRVRFLIDITDHTYWLGTNSFDYCIEFRNFGFKIAMDERKISKDKLLMLPYYPIIDKAIPFKGLPFDSNSKYFFSGGAIYKTIGDNDLYYKMVEHILDEHKDLFFYYLGNGDTTHMELLKSKFPGRVYYEGERKDFYQIMERCDFYFSTYPIWGGLMTQYAAMAGKLPLTLFREKQELDVLLHTENLPPIQFESEDALYEEVDRIQNDRNYKMKMERQLENQVITEEQFKRNLDNIIKMGTSEYPYNSEYVKKCDFGNVLCDGITIKEYVQFYANKRHPFIILAFPKKAIAGGLLKIRWKIKALQKNM